MFWRDIGVVNLPGGKPTLALTGGAAARLAAITPPGTRAQIDVSLTDEPPLAQAIVIITALPADDAGRPAERCGAAFALPAAHRFASLRGGSRPRPAGACDDRSSDDGRPRARAVLAASGFDRT